MRHVVKVIFILLVMCHQVSAAQVSLIDDEDILDAPVVNSAGPMAEEIEDKDNGETDEFSEIDDFIEEENEKLKGIRLLNLDLEYASIELKRREIEQKLEQLNNPSDLNPVMGEEVEGARGSTPRLMAVFDGSTLKKAIITLNGQKMHVMEGQVVEGLTIKTISTQSVLLVDPEGFVQELRI